MNTRMMASFILTILGVAAGIAAILLFMTATEVVRREDPTAIVIALTACSIALPLSWAFYGIALVVGWKQWQNSAQFAAWCIPLIIMVVGIPFVLYLHSEQDTYIYGDDAPS